MTHAAGRILAIDYGSRRIGVAVSDPTGLIARGVTTLQNDTTTFHKLLQILQQEEVTKIVVGMPYDREGNKGRKAQEVDEFIAQLRQRTAMPIETWDESYSSVNAQRAFIDSGMKKRKRQQKHRVDEMAARLMLQEYLDNFRH